MPFNGPYKYLIILCTPLSMITFIGSHVIMERRNFAVALARSLFRLFSWHSVTIVAHFLSRFTCFPHTPYQTHIHTSPLLLRLHLHSLHRTLCTHQLEHCIFWQNIDVV